MIHKSIILYLSLFLISLQSYYLYSINVAIFPYIGVILIVFLSTNKNIKLNIILIILSFFALYTLLITFFNSFSTEVKLVSFFGMLFSMLLLLFKDNFEYFTKFIPYYLYIHAFFFVIQFVAHYFFGIKIDYLSWFNGEEQRTYTGTFQVFGMQLFRATGLFVEPSTFFIHFAPLVAIKWLLIDKKLDFINAMLILISLLTFSSFGFVFWLIIFTGVIIHNLVYLKLKINFFQIFFIVVLLYVGSFLADYFFFFLDQKIGIGDNLTTNADRIGFIQYLLNRDIITNIFGIGFSPDNIKYTVNDSGMISAIFYRFGIIGLIFFFLLGIFLNSYKKRIIFLTLILTKLSITYPFFWLVYGLLLYKEKTDVWNIRNKQKTT